MGDLKKWADYNNQFFKLELNQEVEVEYKGFKVIPSRFDPEKETIRYTLLVDGVVKYWENSSVVIAEVFDSVSVGSKVKISKEPTKDGKGKYLVSAL